MPNSQPNSNGNIDARLTVIESRLAALERETDNKAQVIDPDRIYTVAEVCAILACGKSNLYDLLKSGNLARINVGSGMAGVRVRGRDITAFINSRRTGGPAPTITLKNLRGKFDR
jgi:excisionase family DNA binding protein